jgi:hypothetical protein
MSLEVQPIQIWQFYVKDQAARSVGPCAAQKILPRAKRFYAPPGRADQRLQRLTDRHVIIDDEDDRLFQEARSQRTAWTCCNWNHDFLEPKARHLRDTRVRAVQPINARRQELSQDFSTTASPNRAFSPYHYFGLKDAASRSLANRASSCMKSDLDGSQQSVPAERLHQAVNGPVIKDAVTVVVLRVSRDEHDRNMLLADCQFSLKVAPAHAGHPEIQDETAGPRGHIRREERFR